MNFSGSDFRLYHGNDLSVLAHLLSETMQEDFDPQKLLVPETVLIPQPAMKRWLQMVLAQQHGIAANLRFLTPGEFVRQALVANGLESGSDIFSAGVMRWRLYAVLADKSQWQHPALQKIAPYLRGHSPELKAWTLANECASAFEKYQAWRRDWCLAWDSGEDPQDWQAHLWREISKGRQHRGQAIARYLEHFEAQDKPAPQGLPHRLFVFACLNVSPDVLRVIATAAKAAPLHFFLPSPSRKYWGDLAVSRERLKNPLEDVFAQEENPLLQSWGRAGRDFIATLFSNNTVSLRGDVEAYLPSGEKTLLARVKNDVLERQAPGACAGGFDPEDTSLQIHSCHTRLREVQVLHDQLHRLFLKDQTLQAREIAIMAPDIEAYAPFIDAVFGAARNTPRFIPFRLSDRKLPQSSALIDVFLRLLDLPTLELTSNEVLDLLEAPALAEHLGIDGDCRRWWPFWIEQAGARWGLNAEHRRQHGVPGDHLTTWAFALDRLLLGYASGEEKMLQGVAPVIEIEGQAMNALDKLIRGLRLLARYNESFRHPRSPSEWTLACGEMLALLAPSIPANSADAAALQTCQQAVADLLEQSRQAEVGQTIAPEIIRDYFEHYLNQSDASQNFLGGGVTVCKMVPMRQIPFKVICLLGMEEAAMPRNEPPGSIQRLSEEIKSPRTRRYGDRSLRDDDRFLFLQLLCAAEKSFYLSFCGKNPRDDTDQAPSSLVSELLDCLAAMHPQQEKFRETFIVQHPLQVFSGPEKNDPRLLRFDPAWHLPPVADRGLPMPKFAATATGTVPEVAGQRVVQWQDLKKFFRNPARAYLQSSLGLRLQEHEALLDEHEPFGTPSELARHRLQHAVFDALTGGDAMPDTARLLAVLRGLGLLPAGHAAEPVLYKTLSEVKRQALRFRAWREGEARVQAFELPLGKFLLQGKIGNVYASGAARIKFGEMRGRHHCDHGLDALLLSALDDRLPLVEFVELKDKRVVQRNRPAPGREQALQHLGELLGFFVAGCEAPLPFLPDAGFAFAGHKMARAERIDEHAWEAAAKAKAASRNDRWWTTAMRGQDPFDEHPGDPDDFPNSRAFRDISLAVFSACAPDMIGNAESGHD